MFAKDFGLKANLKSHEMIGMLLEAQCVSALIWNTQNLTFTDYRPLQDLPPLHHLNLRCSLYLRPDC